tara:strand:- start:1569 stop:2252 length:684 start_codon:yes stop_codon:yes gene_type:complete
MSRFGWAYVDCEPQGSATGPTGSVQFLTGAGFTSGTADFMFYTSSATGPAGQTYSSNTLALTGTLIVRGIISASHYHIENVAEMDSTGSTSFGNTNDDSHARTGSLSVIRENGTVVLNADNSTETTTVRALKVLYSEVTNTKITASVPNYILGISRTGSVEIALPAASTYGAGAMLVVKDEVTDRGGTHILLTASAGDSIDGSDSYILTGSMPAISLYSNGSNWFVF